MAAKLATYVTDRLAEGWTAEQIAGRLRLGIETGLRADLIRIASLDRTPRIRGVWCRGRQVG